MSLLNQDCFASENEECADFIVNDIFYEIGGLNKKRKKANFVVRDIDSIGDQSLPMLLFGFFE